MNMMASSARPTSSGSRPSTSSSTRADQTNEPKEIWSTLLKSVSSHKSVPSRNLLVMGGGTTGINDFVRGLASATRQIGGGNDGQSKHKRKQSGLPTLEGTLALGYTYIDIHDEENDDILARLTFSLFPNPSASLTPLLHETFTPSLLEQTACVILLDWSTPWKWLRELRDWISVVMRFLHETTKSSGKANEYERVINDNIARCESAIRGYSEKPDVSTSQVSAEAPLLPLSEGEYDEPIGLPLVVVCQNVDKMDLLEREMGYKEELFDFIQQYLRTILLKHGASLHYLSPGHHQSHLSLLTLLSPSSVLRPIIPVQQYNDLLKPNVVDRDRVFVPSGWDSWGKIRVLRDGFDVEGVCEGWSVDLASKLNPDTLPESQAGGGGALEVYEDTVPDPKRSTIESSTAAYNRDSNSVTIIPEQSFLSQQLTLMENRISKDPPETPQRSVLGTPRRTNPTQGSIGIGEGVERMVGVTSVNLGGIDVDVEDVADRLRRLKEREVTPTLTSPGSEGFSYPPSEIDSPAPEMSPLVAQGRPAMIQRISTPRGTPTKGAEQTQGDGDDKLKNFFQSLLVNKGK